MHGVSKLDLKNSKAPTKAILGTRQLKPGYGLPINPSHVISSLSRPVHEPPALEVLDMFESKEWEDELEAWEKSISDVQVRTKYVDLMMELATGVRYGEWVVQTGKEAILREDLEREKYYEGLLESLKVEVKDILGDVARMEKEELPVEYAFAQKVVRLEEDLFRLRPKLEKRRHNTFQPDDENLNESHHEDLVNEEETKTNQWNITVSARRLRDVRTGAAAGYGSTMDGVLLLPKFSIQAFAKNVSKGMRKAQSCSEDDID